MGVGSRFCRCCFLFTISTLEWPSFYRMLNNLFWMRKIISLLPLLGICRCLRPVSTPLSGDLRLLLTLAMIGIFRLFASRSLRRVPRYYPSSPPHSTPLTIIVIRQVTLSLQRSGLQDQWSSIESGQQWCFSRFRPPPYWGGKWEWREWMYNLPTNPQ